jgi:hypothetical protein
MKSGTLASTLSEIHNVLLKTLPFVLFLFGSLLSIWLSYSKPMWLDEKYSLIYSFKYNFTDLVFFFGEDNHPGIFYALVKIVYYLVPSAFFIRLLLAVIPQLAGIYILITNLVFKSKFPRIALLTVLTLNIFFLNLSWQMRMYSFVFLCTALVIIQLSEFLKRDTPQNLRKLSMYLLIGSGFYYPFFFVTFCVFTYLYMVKKLVLSRVVWMFLINSIVILLLVGPLDFLQPKKFLAGASWIEGPSINNVAAIHLNVLGIVRDINMETSLPQVQFPLVYYFILSVLFFLIIYKRIKLSRELTIAFGGFFLLFILSLAFQYVSRITPLSGVFPKVSFMIPRAHLAFVIFFWVGLARQIDKNLRVFSTSKVKKYLFMICISGFLIWQSFYGISFLFAKNNKQLDIAKEVMATQLICAEKTAYIWPEWLVWESVHPETIQLLPNIETQYVKNLVFKQTMEESFAKHEYERAMKLIVGSNIIIKNTVVNSLDDERSELVNIVSASCKIRSQTNVFSYWEC